MRVLLSEGREVEAYMHLFKRARMMCALSKSKVIDISYISSVGFLTDLLILCFLSFFGFSLSQLGLLVCPSKCQAYCRDASVHWSSDVPISFSGIQILGSPIGDDDYIQTFCLSIAHSGADLCSKLPHLNDPQSSTLRTMSSANSEWRFWFYQTCHLQLASLHGPTAPNNFPPDFHD